MGFERSCTAALPAALPACVKAGRTFQLDVGVVRHLQDGLAHRRLHDGGGAVLLVVERHLYSAGTTRRVEGGRRRRQAGAPLLPTHLSCSPTAGLASQPGRLQPDCTTHVSLPPAGAAAASPHAGVLDSRCASHRGAASREAVALEQSTCSMLPVWDWTAALACCVQPWQSPRSAITKEMQMGDSQQPCVDDARSRVRLDAINTSVLLLHHSPGRGRSSASSLLAFPTAPRRLLAALFALRPIPYSLGPISEGAASL